MISSRPTSLPFSRIRRISKSMGMRSRWIACPEQVSSYRLKSKTNFPNRTFSVVIQPTAASRPFYSLIASGCPTLLQTIYRSSPLQPAGSDRKIRTYFVEPTGSQKTSLRISLLSLTFALAVFSTVTAHASGCSNSTIRGSYAFTIHGTIFLPNGSALLVDGIAKETYDGEGGMTQVDAVATNGNLTPGWRLGPAPTP
jgi:hypothetical protein